MAETMKLYFELNGEPRYVDIDPGETLLSLLRRLGMTSVKEGCDTGDCGACTVLVNGRAIRSCMTLAAQVRGKSVITMEGLGDVHNPHPIQRAFAEVGAVQCGFCTPGMISVAYELLSRNDDPTPEEVREAIAGNLCRCTGYVKIVEAILLAAKWKREGKW
jgi:carbon-monoxide dehydrogenase small subunit